MWYPKSHPKSDLQHLSLREMVHELSLDAISVSEDEDGDAVGASVGELSLQPLAVAAEPGAVAVRQPVQEVTVVFWKKKSVVESLMAV